MKSLALLALLCVPCAAAEGDAQRPFLSLFQRVSAYLNTPAIKNSPRRAAVAAVRGGISTDQGEDLDLRLLERANDLRGALKRPDASKANRDAARPVYEALAVSHYIQALSVKNATKSRAEAAQELASWARVPRKPALPDAVIHVLTGPAGAIDDKLILAAGWARYVRALAPGGIQVPPPEPGWTANADVARLDETLKGVTGSWLEHNLDPESEAAAHLLAGRLYDALAQANLKGDAPAKSGPTAVLTLDDGPAPAETDLPPFDAREIYIKASKSVVLILAASDSGTGELGTGSVVDAARHLILTNAHVVIQESTRQPWSRVQLYFKPARLTGDPKKDLSVAHVGRVISWNSELDLALVEARLLPQDTPALSFAHPSAVNVGDRVAAIGHPEQGGLWTLTTGVISAVVSDLGGVKGKNAYQTDASINRGNSGGPLLDSSGRLIGVNTSMSRKAADGLAITSVNFALRSGVARRWLAEQGARLAYAPAGLAPSAPVVLARTPSPKPAPLVVASAPVKFPKAKPMMLTESKPFSGEELIEAEISKMEELGSEMHDQIMHQRPQ